ncbi:hypothetical protein KCP71_15490 [Salmonella enterica subsp. enterica]|nr:hypothetical protein KCP71_15490 [Salmonella enterica subsp. enterica]
MVLGNMVTNISHQRGAGTNAGDCELFARALRSSRLAKTTR